MKLSKIYTNQPQHFKSIKFNDGFNVILGKAIDMKKYDRDSHNLGKSLLIDVIDYCLLKGVSAGHFTKSLPEPLNKIEFYLEILLNKGTYLTIKRGIKKNTKICFKESLKNDQDFTKIHKDEWDHFELGLDRSKDFLEGKVNLTAISTFGYRMGVSYFLRKQKDYLNVFQVEKFSYGKHIGWKPYIGKILGFTPEIIKEKYYYEDVVDEKSKELEKLRGMLAYQDEPVDKLRARIEAEEQRARALETKLDSFDFRERDLQISEKDLQEIDDQIANTNNEIYNLNSDLGEISKSLNANISFNIKTIKKIFKEVGIYFKGPIVKEYNDLEKFNTRLTKDRKKRLKDQRERIKEVLEQLKESLEKLNTDKVFKLSIIRERDSFKKYKKMQNELVGYKATLQELHNDLKRFEDLKVKAVELNSLKEILNEKIEQLNNEVERGNDALTTIRSFFRKIVSNVLNTGALLYVGVNDGHNIGFFASYTRDEDPTSQTSEGEGTSYHKFLCAFFDLAVLRYYKDLEFYRFVYHDGILEGLDDRKKISLIKVIREYATQYNIQYILTVIESDLPYYESDEKFNFSNEEIIRELTDEDERGRLFNCPIF